MDDLISRQAAIDALDIGCELLRRVLDDTDVVGVERAKYEWGLGLIESYISDMRDLPSAQPKRMKGRWLKKESVGRWDDTLWECSECGCLHSDDVFCISGDFNFCPNCGAWMSEESESEHTMDEFMHGQDLGSPEDGSL